VSGFADPRCQEKNVAVLFEGKMKMRGNKDEGKIKMRENEDEGKMNMRGK
jgi:hypothetical protein